MASNCPNIAKKIELHAIDTVKIVSKEFLFVILLVFNEP